MVKIERTSAPKINTDYDCLEYERNKDVIRDRLIELTKDCCSYCCGRDVSADGGCIEHFLPKKHYPSRRCEYDNLFWSCNLCNNTKGERFYGTGENGELGRLEYEPLKFDSKDYKFHEWFDINSFTGEITPVNDNGIDNLKYNRAKVTIELFGLNKGIRPKLRADALKKWEKKESFEYTKYESLIKHYLRLD